MTVELGNIGCVCNPRRSLSSDLRATYVLLEADATSYDVSIRRVPYDTQTVIQSIEEHHVFSNPEWLIAKFTET